METAIGGVFQVRTLVKVLLVTLLGSVMYSVYAANDGNGWIYCTVVAAAAVGAYLCMKDEIDNLLQI